MRLDDRVPVLAAAVVASALGAPALASEAPRFFWDPIPSSHWVMNAPASSRADPPAVRIFSKLHVDDSELREDAIVTLRERTRILRDGGRGFAEVKLPDVEHQLEIREIHARTVHADGTEHVVRAEDILHRLDYQDSEFASESRTILMPAVTDGCIVDLWVQFVGTAPAVWPVQQDVPVLQFELVWHPWHASKSVERYLMQGGEKRIPRHLWVNPTETCQPRVEMVAGPSPGSYRFEARNVPPFDEEPMSLPSTSERTYLYFYYGSSGYWSHLTEVLRRNTEFYDRQDPPIDSILEIVERGDSPEMTARAAYAALSARVKVNNAVRIEGNYEERMSEIVKRGEGSSLDVGRLYRSVLQELDVPSHLAFLRDRRQGPLDRQAHFWQFTRSIVVVDSDAGTPIFLSPGEEDLAFGELPWHLEGVQAFVSRGDRGAWQETPRSSAEDNRTVARFVWSLTGDRSPTGTLDYRLQGESARRFRTLTRHLEGVGLQHEARAWIEREFDRVEVKHVEVAGREDSSMPIRLEAGVAAPIRVAARDGVATLRPFLMLGEAPDDLVPRPRTQPFDFPYAYRSTVTTEIQLPDGWTVLALPRKHRTRNTTGTCSVEATRGERAVSLTLDFLLSEPFVEAQRAEHVYDLFTARAESENVAVRLTTAP